MTELEPKQLEEVVNSGGRPAVEEVDKRFSEALILYLRGVASGKEIGEKLGVSHQTGSILIKKIRTYLGEMALDQDGFEENKRLAILRAENLLQCAWADYHLTGEPSDRNKFLNTILSTLKHLSDLAGITAGMTIKLRTSLLTQADSGKLLQEIGLTDEDFTDENYQKTLIKIMNHYNIKE